MPHPVETLDQYRALQQAAATITFTPDRISHLVYVYKLHISNSHVCVDCSSTLIAIRDALRELLERVRPQWEATIAAMNRQAVIDYKSASGTT